MRRFPLAFLILGVLSLLAAGAVALAVLESPTVTATAAVHQGADETLGATRVAGEYTATYLPSEVISFVFSAPDTATETALTPKGTVKKRRSLVGTEATSFLQPVRVLSSLSDFVRQRDGSYVSTEPISHVLPKSKRAGITGTYRTTVRVTGDYVVGVALYVQGIEKGQQFSETIDYKITAVGGWRS
ncbi:MAG: hypothetical protein ACRDWE_03410 [Acidimicrobiales bacterium]